MSNPCEINDCVPAEEIAAWRRWKLWPFLALLLLGLLFLLLRSCGGDAGTTTAVTPTETAVAVATAAPEEDRIDLVAPSLAFGGLAAGKALLSGVGTPGSIMRIFDGDVEIGQADVGSDGNWSFNADANRDSRYRAVAELADGTPAGETGGLVLATAGIANLMARGFTADATDFSIGGTGQPGLDVNVMFDGTNAGTATVDGDGTWSLNSGLPALDPGEYVVSAEMVDGDGDVYDSIANAGKLRITAPVAGLTAGDFTVDGTTMRWSGTGEPGATVNIMLNGEVIGSTVVDADGNWSFEGDIGNLQPGEYVVSAEMADGSAMLGSTGNAGSFTISAPEPEPAAPLTTGDLDAADGIYTWSGTGEPGATIDIYLDGQLVGSTTVADDGTWTFEGSYAGFDAGDYPLTARMVDGSGNTLEEAVEAALLSLNASAAGNAGGDSDATGSLRVLFAGAGDGSDGGEGTADSGAGIAPAGSPGVALILDSSWSMTFGVDYTGIDIGPDTDESQRLTADDPNSRIAVAKSGLTEFVTGSLPEGTPSALRVFGNLRGNLECQTDLMVPFGPLDKGQMVSTIEGVRPQFNANTALGASLDAIRTDLAGAESELMTIVLLTDGDETCGGDPEAAIQALTEEGYDVTVNVIGFAINDDALKQKLQSWAELGNGTYFDAPDADTLASSLTGAFAIPYRVLDADGAEVASGTIGGPAVDLPVGDYTVELGTSPATTYDTTVSADETTIVTTE